MKYWVKTCTISYREDWEYCDFHELPLYYAIFKAFLRMIRTNMWFYNPEIKPTVQLLYNPARTEYSIWRLREW